MCGDPTDELAVCDEDPDCVINLSSSETDEIASTAVIAAVAIAVICCCLCICGIAAMFIVPVFSGAAGVAVQQNNKLTPAAHQETGYALAIKINMVLYSFLFTF